MKKFIIIISIFLIGCEKFGDVRYLIRVKNKSNQTIAVCANYQLPDTTLPLNKPTLLTASPGKQAEIYDDDVGDTKFKRFETEKLTIFILSNDTVSKYPWDTIRKYNNILKKLELDHQDLINLGGDVIYP